MPGLGWFNLNSIGAYIFTVILIGLLLRRPPWQEIEEAISALPFYVHIVVTSFLLCIGLENAFGYFRDISLIHVLSSALQWTSFWVHEAGHFYWSWAGKTMHILGGTLNEIAFTFGVGLYFLFKGRTYLSCLFFFFFGHVLFGVSRYVGDAREQALPIAGSVGLHDWHTLLGMYSLLDMDDTFAEMIWILGITALISSLGYLLLYRATQREKTRKSDLN